MVINNIKNFFSSSKESFPKYFIELISLLEAHQNIDKETFDLIYDAYLFGKKHHANQKRKSGEPYYIHCVAVAQILASWGMDKNIIIAGLLHDTIEDTIVTKEDIQKLYGDDILFLVESVTNLSGIKFNSRNHQKAENFMKMFISFAKDIRAILIKLADRLHNLQTISYLPRIKQRRFALESKEIFAPLAHRIGMNKVKMEMEDIIFSILESTQYKKIQKLVKSSQSERNKYITSFIKPIKSELKNMDLSSEVFGRAKHIYSINNKMKLRNISFSEIFDQFAIRIIVDKVEECYMILGLVHQIYTPIQDRFKDYIAMPKSNGYQSIHTTVFGKNGKMVEIQIRTTNMNKIAEIGVAAHWIYKDTSLKMIQKDKILEKFAWIKEVIEELNSDEKNPQDFLDMLKIDLFNDEIFVFTPNGDVIQLVENATPIDFAFQVHSQVGLKCSGAKVNGQIVPLNTELKSGDTIEILTSEKKKPNISWLQIVKMPKSKNHIKRWIKQNDLREKTLLGEEILDKGLRKLKKINLLKKIKDNLSTINSPSLEDLFISLANGKVTVRDIISKIEPQSINIDEDEDESLTEKFIRKARGMSKGVSVGGIDNTLINYARCCNPIPGDEIIGYITLGRGVTIHRINCSNYSFSDSDRLIVVNWQIDSSTSFMVRLKITGEDRKNLAKDIVECTSLLNMNLSSIDMKGDSGLARCMIIVEVRDTKQLDKLNKKLRTITRVYTIERK